MDASRIFTGHTAVVEVCCCIRFFFFLVVSCIAKIYCVVSGNVE